MSRAHYFLADFNLEMIKITTCVFFIKMIRHQNLICKKNRGAPLFGSHRYNLRIRLLHFSMKTLMQQTLYHPR